MEFDLISFTLHPTTEVFECSRKVDLLLIADFFNVSVPRDVAKGTIKQVLHDRLVETGILPEPTAMEEEDVSPDVGLGAVSDRTLPNVEPVDPTLAIKMKELDLLIKQEERETLLVKLRLIEAEADQAFRLQHLKDQDLKNRPVPKAWSRPPSVSSLAAAPQSLHESGANTSFDVSKNLKLVPPFTIYS